MELLKLQPRFAWVLAGLLFAVPALGSDFGHCHEKVIKLLTHNKTIALDTNGTVSSFALDFDPIFHGPLRGFDVTASPRPLTLTRKGCMRLCGSTADLNDVLEAFQILTTWVLPAVALLCQLPYESLSKRKRKNLEAFLNWVGSPAATLSTTMYNIHMIQHCHELSEDLDSYARDAYYVLSCINQYEFPSTINAQHPQTRNTSLMRGTLWPLIFCGDNEGTLAEIKWRQLKAHTSNLAFQLRLQRRKAVWPLAVSIIWFFVAFAISIVTAFADLGDNTKAHSLALGLLLSWLPVVVVMAIVDRNPLSSTRCQTLIERWLYDVEQIVDTNSGDNPRLWHRQADTIPFSIGEFVGQGRRLRYCGVTNAVLSKIRNPEKPHLTLPDLVSDHVFETTLVTRPWSWWVIWILSQGIVTTGFAMALMVSFNTPTIGFGCRSLLYLVWYLVSSVNWAVLGFSQEPRRWLRAASWIPNALATCLLFLIMGFQVTNGLNTCLCKSSVFGTSDYGGYMDFENGAFYHRAYGVQRFWGPAAGFGLVNCIAPILWAIRRWGKSDTLWKTKENGQVDELGDLELMWLT